MKLLHISPSYFPAFRFGGPIQSVHLLNKALVKKGIKVDVLTTNAGLTQEQREKIKEKSKEIRSPVPSPLNSPDGSGQAARDDTERRVPPGWAAQDDKDGWNDVDGVRVSYCDFVGYEHYNFSLQMVKEIWKIIDNYDLVHITAVWNFPVLAGALISLIKKRPYIISPRGVFHQEALISKSRLLKKVYFNLLARHYLKKASAIHYTSEIEKEESEKFLENKNSFVVSNGIDLKSIENGDPCLTAGRQRSERSIKEKYILILGRIDRIKGFDILIPAFAKIAKEYSDLNLVIAGEDNLPYVKEVRKMIEQRKISDKVIFTGQITGDDKWSLYKNALMFVLPSYSENFGMSIIEAMACNCPVIISEKVGIYKDVEAADAGIIIKTTIESVYKGIEMLIEDKILRECIAMNGGQLVEENYSIEIAAKKMIQLYEWILYKTEKPEFVI